MQPLTPNDTAHPLQDTDGADLIACPSCDALYREQIPPKGGRAVCARCSTVLIRPRAHAGLRIIALTLAINILVTAAVFFPFLEIHAAGLGNRTSLLDIATSFRSGILVLVSVATISMIVLIPLLGPGIHRRPLVRAQRAEKISAENKVPLERIEFWDPVKR